MQDTSSSAGEKSSLHNGSCKLDNSAGTHKARLHAMIDLALKSHWRMNHQTRTHGWNGSVGEGCSVQQSTMTAHIKLRPDQTFP